MSLEIKKEASVSKQEFNGMKEVKSNEETYRTSHSNLESQNSDVVSDYEHNLKKGLSNRHIQLIALGGCIGTGLFVGTSSTLTQCGPAPLFLSFIIISTMVYCIMCTLAEMVCYLPQQGSVPELVTRYVDPSLGFAAGWNYAYSYAMLVATELTAAAGIVRYWTDQVPQGVWITIFLIVVVVLNFSAVRFYGESEFWFASLKIICILALLVVSIVIFFGGAPNHDRVGFRYWRNPGAFGYHITGGNLGRFLDLWTAIIKSAFAFILSPELVGLACVEAKDTRRNIEKASRRFIYRIIFFYLSSSLMIGVIVAKNDHNLLLALEENRPGAASSPFVQGIANSGIPVLNHVINVAILTSAWSAGNSFFYASSRSILALSKQGDAPKIFSKINRFGVPYNAVFLCSLVACLAYLNVSSTSSKVFQWLSNICTISGFIGWFLIGVAYIRFRKAILFNRLLDRIPYRSPLQPFSAYFFTIVVAIITLTNGYVVFIKGRWDYKDFLTSYISLPIFLAFYLGHKTIYKTRFCIPVDQIDVITGLEEAEEEAKLSVVRVPKNAWEKFINWLL
ncbi:proline permease PUT4 Ecym_8035 [Eremothecium cymbalariae DBVPG|uniref:Amino acid permease/ SLC12A domain-containing protein n=1 Tax=Eremothecium cymbalariae (strain CBS 270.75 / DBVPG 7215 / KCTC 17166 / NRRL Y-17582) TaxID=931890 RepID=G8JWV7_ERECY|nr:Hypothetical protein Ecym_8035 [Eremothecium cymbalariae DBVPG\